jgi:hypothetical protein
MLRDLKVIIFFGAVCWMPALAAHYFYQQKLKGGYYWIIGITALTCWLCFFVAYIHHVIKNN